MPNCFQLTRKGEKEPSPLLTIDKEMCDHFGEECDPKLWFRNWYNTIGFLLATGSDWAKIRETYDDSPHMLEVIEYLEANYTFDAWAEIGRRW